MVEVVGLGRSSGRSWHGKPSFTAALAGLGAKVTREPGTRCSYSLESEMEPDLSRRCSLGVWNLEGGCTCLSKERGRKGRSIIRWLWADNKIIGPQEGRKDSGTCGKCKNCAIATTEESEGGGH